MIVNGKRIIYVSFLMVIKINHDSHIGSGRGGGGSSISFGSSGRAHGGGGGRHF